MNWPTVWVEKGVNVKSEMINKTFKDRRKSSVNCKDECDSVHLLCGPVKGPKPQILPFCIWTG